MAKDLLNLSSYCMSMVILVMAGGDRDARSRDTLLQYQALCIGIGSAPGDVFVTRNDCLESPGFRRIVTRIDRTQTPAVAITDLRDKIQHVMVGGRTSVLLGDEIRRPEGRAMLDRRLAYPFWSLERQKAEFVRPTFPFLQSQQRLQAAKRGHIDGHIAGLKCREIRRSTLAFNEENIYSWWSERSTSPFPYLQIVLGRDTIQGLTIVTELSEALANQTAFQPPERDERISEDTFLRRLAEGLPLSHWPFPTWPWHAPESSVPDRLTTLVGQKEYEYDVIEISFLDSDHVNVTKRKCFQNDRALRVEWWDDDEEDPGARVTIVHFKDKIAFSGWMKPDKTIHHPRVADANSAQEARRYFERLAQGPFFRTMDAAGAVLVKNDTVYFQTSILHCTVKRTNLDEERRFLVKYKYAGNLFTWWSKTPELSFPVQQAFYEGGKLRSLVVVTNLKSLRLPPFLFEMKNAQPIDFGALKEFDERAKRSLGRQ